jgi:hypothetical protein
LTAWSSNENERSLTACSSNENKRSSNENKRLSNENKRLSNENECSSTACSSMACSSNEYEHSSTACSSNERNSLTAFSSDERRRPRCHGVLVGRVLSTTTAFSWDEYRRRRSRRLVGSGDLGSHRWSSGVRSTCVVQTACNQQGKELRAARDAPTTAGWWEHHQPGHIPTPSSRLRTPSSRRCCAVVVVDSLLIV